MHVAVVGHVEWIEFARVDKVPAAGEIVHAGDGWEEPGGGGAVAALQLMKLASACEFFTAIGADELGVRAVRELRRLGVRVHEVIRSRKPTRKAITFVDATGERTITTIGERLEPRATDPLPWQRLDGADAVYITAGDPGAFRLARRARVVVVTSRVLDRLAASGIRADAVVGSSRDPSESFDASVLAAPPNLVVLTEGPRGGTYRADDRAWGTFESVPAPGPVVDVYGAGDSFAAGLTWALGAKMDVRDALAVAARCGAWAVTGRGVQSGQITAADLS